MAAASGGYNGCAYQKSNMPDQQPKADAISVAIIEDQMELRDGFPAR